MFLNPQAPLMENIRVISFSWSEGREESERHNLLVSPLTNPPLRAIKRRKWERERRKSSILLN
jgi:hypothetical protein